MPPYATTDDFAQYLASTLGTAADDLGWSIAARDYDAIIAAALKAYGVSTITLATDTAKLEALGQRELWRAVLAVSVTLVDTVSASGESVKLSQIHERATAMYRLHDRLAASYVPASTTGRRRSISVPTEYTA